MEEFADHYVELIRKLRMRQIALEDRMLEHYDQYKFNKKKLGELEKSLKANPTAVSYFQRKCQVDLIECRHLPPSIQYPKIRVVLETVSGGMPSRQVVGETHEKSSDNPVFNEIIQTNVAGDQDTIVLVMFDGSIQVPLESRLPLKVLRDGMSDPELPVKEEWFPFEEPGSRSRSQMRGEEVPEIRVSYNYLYNQVMMLDSQCGEWKRQLE